MTEKPPIIRLDEVTRVYPTTAGEVRALDRVSLDVRPGEFMALMGPSGSGKSTLLRLIGCLDTPTTGDVLINGHSATALSDDGLAALRRDHIGFVFQQGNLLPRLSILENIQFPLSLRDRRDGARERCLEVLSAVGLSPDLLARRPEDLPGGEQQKVAIARALVNDPGILLCDEPTGALASGTGEALMGLLADLNRKGKTILLGTHDPRIAGIAGRIIRITDGRIS